MGSNIYSVIFGFRRNRLLIASGEVPPLLASSASIHCSHDPDPPRLLEKYREYAEEARQAPKTALSFVCENQWRTGKGPLQGDRLVDLLLTVPGVGQTTALSWLAEVCEQY